MPPLVIPAGFAAVSHTLSGASLPTGAAVTYGLDIQGYAGDLQALAADVYLDFNTHITPLMGGSIRHESCRVKEGPNATGPFHVHTGEGIGDAGSVLAPNTSYLFTKNTSLGGRRGRGRMYLPGLREADADNSGLLAAGVIVAVNAALSSWLGALNSDNLPMVILHDTAAVVPTDVNNMTVAARAATQRRRLRR